MFSISLFALFITLYVNQVIFTNAQEYNISLSPFSLEFIKFLNYGNHSWRAHPNFPTTANIKVVRRLMGTSLRDKSYPAITTVEYELDRGEQIPESFDCRTQWEYCPTLNEISEQGLCASCWAVVAAATMTDRYCIFSNQTLQNRFSTHNLLSCCLNSGCGYGGEMSVAWQYWKLFGVVSGGPYNTTDGCQPYELPPCDFATVCNTTLEIPVCRHKCRSGYDITFKNDKKKGKRIYAINGGETQIQMAMMKGGPVQSVMEVYEDFLSYKSGVYRYIGGRVCGGHSVKLLGWGEEHGVKYWLAANSWGTRWGDQGFFKILRGEDHCEIESTVMAGEPDIVNKGMLGLRIKDNTLNLNFHWNTEI